MNLVRHHSLSPKSAYTQALRAEQFTGTKQSTPRTTWAAKPQHPLTIPQLSQASCDDTRCPEARASDFDLQMLT